MDAEKRKPCLSEISGSTEVRKCRHSAVGGNFANRLVLLEAKHGPIHRGVPVRQYPFLGVGVISPTWVVRFEC